MKPTKSRAGDDRIIAAKNIRSARTAVAIVLVSILARPVLTQILDAREPTELAITFIEVLALFSLVIVFLNMAVRNVRFRRRNANYRAKGKG